MMMIKLTRARDKTPIYVDPRTIMAVTAPSPHQPAEGRAEIWTLAKFFAEVMETPEEIIAAMHLEPIS
jgi:hypothetical protein